MNKYFNAANAITLLHVIRTYSNIIDVDRLQYIHSNQVCNNVTNGTIRTNQHLYIFARSNVSLELLDIAEMDIQYNYIFVAKHYNNILHANKDICGHWMIETNRGFYLLNYSTDVQLQSQLQISPVYQHSLESKNFDLEMQTTKEQLHHYCQMLKSIND